MILSPRSRSLRAVFRVEEIAAEAIAEFLGVPTIGKTKDGHVDVVLTIRVAARAQRQPLRFAEKVHRQVGVARAAIRGQRYLMRPPVINDGFAQLIFAIDHGASELGRRPRSTLLAVNGGRTRSRSGGRRWISVAELEQKGNKNMTAPCWGTRRPGK